ncbi:MAG: hypothetical protein H6740_25880 [Alphaproteobacteria bacterium]|nr:hypothetical protein [Alphaproteobacteria bacterium]
MSWLLLPCLALAAPPVLLLDAGAEPRAPLRYTLEPGTRTLSQTNHTRSELELRGLPDPEPSATRTELGWTVHTEDGGALRVSLHAASETGGADGAVDPARFVGHAGTLRFDARGQLLESSWAADPAGLSEAETRRLRDMERGAGRLLVPLPEEPVGLGASWQVSEQLAGGPMTVTVLTTYRWVGGEAPELELEVSYTASSEPTELDFGEEFKGQVKELAVTGRQSVQLDLSAAGDSRAGRTKTRVVVSGWRGLLPIELTMDITAQNSQSGSP